MTSTSSTSTSAFPPAVVTVGGEEGNIDVLARSGIWPGDFYAPCIFVKATFSAFQPELETLWRKGRLHALRVEKCPMDDFACHLLGAGVCESDRRRPPTATRPHDLAWHRTTVKCSIGRVRHATAEQLPLGRSFMLSMHRCHLVVISKSLWMCLWTSTCRRDAHETRQASRNLISSSQMMRRELQPPLFRHELLTQPCLLLKNTFFAQCHMGTVASVTPPSSRSNEAMPSTPPFQSFPFQEGRRRL